LRGAAMLARRGLYAGKQDRAEFPLRDPVIFRLFRGYRIFVAFDHLLDHLSADRAGLTRGKIAVVTLVKSNAYFACSLLLELLKCCLLAVVSHLFLLEKFK